MYHHVFTERQKSRRNKTIIEKKATIIVKKKRQHAITSLSHRCHGFQVLVLPSPQDRAPAPIHALHSPYHLACIRLVPYDYPTHATKTTKYRAQAEQESSICRSPATPGHCQDHVHTRHEVQSRARDGFETLSQSYAQSARELSQPFAALWPLRQRVTFAVLWPECVRKCFRSLIALSQF